VKAISLRHISIAVAVAGGATAFLAGDFDRAEEHLKTFYTKIQAADFKAARASIDEAVRLWPSNARYHTWRGYVNSQQLPSQCSYGGPKLEEKVLEQVRTAAADYQRALALNSRDAVAHHNLGWLYHLQGLDKQARQEWELAIETDPATAIYRLSLGLFLNEQGDAAGADAHYASAIEATPIILDSPFFTRFRQQSPARAGAVLTEVRSTLERRLGNANDPILKARLGKLALYNGDLAKAVDLLNSAARDLPNLPLVWFNLGEAWRRRGDLQQAWQCYNKAKFLDASLAGPPLRIGEMYLRAGQRAQATESLRTATQRWGQVKPVTAGHNTRIYGGVPQPIDDLLPTTLVWFTTACEASEAYTALAGLAPGNKTYASRSATCESLPAPHSGDVAR